MEYKGEKDHVRSPWRSWRWFEEFALPLQGSGRALGGEEVKSCLSRRRSFRDGTKRCSKVRSGLVELLIA